MEPGGWRAWPAHRILRPRYHLVTPRIEERVLKTVDMKRNLFAGVFDGESDEVSFESLGQRQFLQSVRELIGESTAAPAVQTVEPPSDPNLRLLTAGVQLLEALADVLAQRNGTLPTDLSERVSSAVRKITGEIDNGQADS